MKFNDNVKEYLKKQNSAITLHHENITTTVESLADFYDFINKEYELCRALLYFK